MLTAKRNTHIHKKNKSNPYECRQGEPKCDVRNGGEAIYAVHAGVVAKAAEAV